MEIDIWEDVLMKAENQRKRTQSTFFCTSESQILSLGTVIGVVSEHPQM